MQMRVSLMGMLGFYWGNIGIMERKIETTKMGLYRIWGLGHSQFSNGI